MRTDTTRSMILGTAVLLAVLPPQLHAQVQHVEPEADALPEGATVRLGTSRFKYDGHLRCLRVSPDGRFVATVDEYIERWDQRLTTRVWRIDTGRVVLELRDEGRAADFSPDGRLLATTTGVWEISTGKRLLTLEARGHYQDVAFSADGRFLAIQSHQIIRILGVPDFELIGELKFDTYVESVTISTDGRYVASVVHGKNLSTAPHIWRVQDTTLVRELNFRDEPNGRSRVTCVRFSSDGKTIAGVDSTSLSHSDDRVHWWDVETGRELKPLHEVGRGYSDLALEPDGDQLVAVTSYDGSVVVWDTQRAEPIRKINARASHVTFTPDGESLVTGGGHSLRFWSTATGEEKPPFEGHHDRVTDMSFSPDGRLLASCSDDGTVRVWNASTGRQELQLEGLGPRQGSADFSPDGRLLVAAGFHTTRPDGVRIWELPEGRLHRELDTRSRAAWFLPNGTTLLTWSERGLGYWDIETGDQIRHFDARTDWWNPLPVISQDRTRIVFRGTPLEVREVETGYVLHEIKSRNITTAVDISPRGRLLATATGFTDGTDVFDTDSATLRLFEMETGEQARAIPGFKRSLSSLAFSPDGRSLAIAGFDRTVGIWDVAKGTRRLDVPAPQRRVHEMTFSADGRLLATADDTGTILLWDLTELERAAR